MKSKIHLTKTHLILLNYWNFTNLILLLFFSVVFLATFISFPLLPVVSPAILNLILEVGNDTFEKSLAYQIEYFVDLDKHFLFPFLHMFCTSIISGIIYSNICISGIIFIYYVMASFELVRWVKKRSFHVKVGIITLWNFQKFDFEFFAFFAYLHLQKSPHKV